MLLTQLRCVNGLKSERKQRESRIGQHAHTHERSHTMAKKNTTTRTRKSNASIKATATKQSAKKPVVNSVDKKSEVKKLPITAERVASYMNMRNKVVEMQSAFGRTRLYKNFVLYSDDAEMKAFKAMNLTYRRDVMTFRDVADVDKALAKAVVNALRKYDEAYWTFVEKETGNAGTWRAEFENDLAHAKQCIHDANSRLMYIGRFEAMDARM